MLHDTTEKDPSVRAGTTGSNRNSIGDSTRDPPAAGGNDGCIKSSGNGQGAEQCLDSGSDKNATSNSDGTTTLNGSQAPLRASFATAPGVAQVDGARDAEKQPVAEEDSKRELTEDDCELELGYAFSRRKKWWILCVIFLVQTSMNFNTSLYSNGILGISQEFQVSQQVARAGAAIFLITYAFGCELWAPWSEEFGRCRILQLSLLLTNIWTLPVGFAPNITTVLISRALGGLSTAGGSVTLGMIADMYDSDHQQYAIAFVVFSSVAGSILGPIVGGFVEMLPSHQAWRWCTWIQLIFGVSVQALHLFTVPETRTTILMDRTARKRRKTRQDINVYGPGEMNPLKERFTFAELMETWSRAFKMLITEPIVRILSLLSGASDAIVFMQIQSMNLIYKQWGFNSWQIGLAFVPFAVGYFIAWMIFIPTFQRSQRKREEQPHDDHAQFESRLQPMLYLSVFLPIGLLVFGAGSIPTAHWIVSMIGTGLIGIANYSIYMATIDYMVCAYGPYSASATGGNGLARDFLAGALTPVAVPFYLNLAPERSRSLMLGSFVLCVISVILVGFAWSVYYKGSFYRRSSPFAQRLSSGRDGISGTHPSPERPQEPSLAQAIIPPDSNVWEAFNGRPRISARQPSFGPTSARGAYMASVHAASRRQSRHNSRNPSANVSRRNSHERLQEAAVPPGLVGLMNLQEHPRLIEAQPSRDRHSMSEQSVYESDASNQPAQSHESPRVQHVEYADEPAHESNNPYEHPDNLESPPSIERPEHHGGRTRRLTPAEAVEQPREIPTVVLTMCHDPDPDPDPAGRADEPQLSPDLGYFDYPHPPQSEQHSAHPDDSPHAPAETRNQGDN